MKMKRNIFSQTIESFWNSLTQKAVEVESLNIFKAALDRFLINKEVKGYRGVGRNVGLKLQADEP